MYNLHFINFIKFLIWRGTSSNNNGRLIFQEMEVALGCHMLFKYRQPDELVSNNNVPNVNIKTALKSCFHGCVTIIE
jgi:hypothetical protein